MMAGLPVLRLGGRLPAGRGPGLDQVRLQGVPVETQ